MSYKTYPLRILKVAEPISSTSLSSPKAVLEYMKAEAQADREMFWVIHLNVKNKVVAKELVAMGAIDHCHISPGLALRGVIARGVPSIMTVHNHPSGEPEPSNEDRHLWRTMREACRLLDVKLVDNLVIAREGYYSEAENGSCK